MELSSGAPVVDARPNAKSWQDPTNRTQYRWRSGDSRVVQRATLKVSVAAMNRCKTAFAHHGAVLEPAKADSPRFLFRWRARFVLSRSGGIEWAPLAIRFEV